jgi:hypothetical protein
MVGLPKVVFSKRLPHIAGKNVRVENGDLVDAVKQGKTPLKRAASTAYPSGIVVNSHLPK